MDKYNELFYRISDAFNLNPMLHDGSIKLSIKVSPEVLERFNRDIKDHIMSSGTFVIGENSDLQNSKFSTYNYMGLWEITLTTD